MAQAGGLAAIIISDTEEVMYMSGSDPSGEPTGHPDPGIPSVLLSKSQGDLLLGALSREREDVRLVASLLPLSPAVGASRALHATCRHVRSAPT